MQIIELSIIFSTLALCYAIDLTEHIFLQVCRSILNNSSTLILLQTFCCVRNDYTIDCYGRISYTIIFHCIIDV